MIKNLARKKHKYFTKAVFVAGLIFLVVPLVCYAWDPISGLINITFGLLAEVVVMAVGRFITLLLTAVISIAGYNKFITEPSISTAWGIVRDFSNMWFILGLLFIAFATILRRESYGMKALLPKLLLMAVLINFSKTICGIMIDFSQVVMLTFVNGFAGVAGQGTDFVKYLKLDDMVNAMKNSTASASSTNSTLSMNNDYGSLIATYLIVIVFMLVAAIAMIAILIVFVMRVIMLWILIVLSPLAFMLSGFPKGQSYASQYWGHFTKYLINGPVLAFFIWLALSTLSNSFDTSWIKINVPAGATGITNTVTFLPFILAIGFLAGGLMMSQQIGGLGSSWGMGAARNLQNRGMNAGRRAVRRTGRAAADLGIGMVNREPVRNALGAIGGSRGLAGGILAATGVRALATRGSVALGDRQHSLEEQAKRYARSAGRDQRIANRIANGSELLAITPWQRERRNQMRNFATSEIGRRYGGAYNTAEIEGHERGMSTEDLGMWNNKEITAVGRSGANLVGNAEMHVRNNATNLGAFNTGRAVAIAGGAAMELEPYLDRTGNIPRDAAGNQIFTYGNMPRDTGTIESLNRETDPTYRHMDVEKDEYGNTKRVVAMVDKEALEGKEEKGLGNLSINAFARGQAQTMAVDFDKLGIEKMKNAGQNFSDIRGVNTRDRQEIADISKRMVDILGQEITKLKSKESMSGGDEERVRHMENAQQRFMEPEKIEHLNLVNSGAIGMTSYRKLGETMVHEEIHGWGVDDENETETLAKSTLAGKGSRASRKKVVDNYIEERDRANVAPASGTKTSAETESAAETKATGEQPLSQGNAGVMSVIIEEDRSNRDLAREIKVAPPDLRDTISELAKSGFQGNVLQFNYLLNQLKQLNKTSLTQTGKFDKLIAGLKKEASPLEMNIITKQLSEAQENL
jgi:hypothetical protein